jgi:hypothetical protein
MLKFKALLHALMISAAVFVASGAQADACHWLSGTVIDTTERRDCPYECDEGPGGVVPDCLVQVDGYEAICSLGTFGCPNECITSAWQNWRSYTCLCQIPTGCEGAIEQQISEWMYCQTCPLS